MSPTGVRTSMAFGRQLVFSSRRVAWLELGLVRLIKFVTGGRLTGEGQKAPKIMSHGGKFDQWNLQHLQSPICCKSFIFYFKNVFSPKSSPFFVLFHMSYGIANELIEGIN